MEFSTELTGCFGSMPAQPLMVFCLSFPSYKKGTNIITYLAGDSEDEIISKGNSEFLKSMIL